MWMHVKLQGAMLSFYVALSIEANRLHLDDCYTMQYMIEAAAHVFNKDSFDRVVSAVF